MSDTSYTGRCFCGQVRYELDAAPRFACHCHCHSCQRASGAPFVTWAAFPATSFRILSGTVSEYRSAPGVRRGHCAVCGTTLTYAHEKRAAEIDIAVVTLDEPERITPQAHIWLQDKAAWVSVEDALPKYSTTVTAGVAVS